MRESKPSLDVVLEQCWSLLVDAASRPGSPMRTPVLGSLGTEGCELRTVVLRACDPSARMIQCHTDTRSPKVREIANCARVQWVFYDPASQVQLRATGIAGVHRSGEWVDAVWSALPARSRQVYFVQDAPGTRIESPADEGSLGPENARTNFAVIACRIDELDWVLLSPESNTRARFEWSRLNVQSSWLAP